jgi:ribosome-associated protein
MPKKDSKKEAIQQIKLCCTALWGGKAENLKILDLNGMSSVTDFFVIASGMSEPHLRALRRAIEGTLRENSIGVHGIEAETGTGWMVIDAFDFMVHLFLPEVRDRYRLESLWKDALEIKVEK